MGCPRGHEHDSIYSLSIRNMVVHCTFLGEQATCKHGSTIFIPIRILFQENLKKKMPRRALVNTKQNVLMPPGHPIMLLKSNLFNMASISVKWSIAVCINLLQVCPSVRHLLWYLCILFMSGAVIDMFCSVWCRFLLFQCC